MEGGVTKTPRNKEKEIENWKERGGVCNPKLKS